MAQTVGQFIEHWRGADGGERAQAQSFLGGLCRALGLEEPKSGDYKFEYSIPGDKGTDFIDLYKRGFFVLEAKQSRAKGERKFVGAQHDLFLAEDAKKTRERSSRAWDVLMLNARQQEENYARHLPAAHELPPFIIVRDVGHCFELYADFTGKGRFYNQFPDRRGFRIFLDDLAKPEPAFPKGALEQTAAIMATLALAVTPLSPAELAQGFKQGRKAELRIRATLASLARTGFISVAVGGQKFTLRRAA